MIGVICPLLPPRVFAKCLPINGMVGGAVGIENNSVWNFKELEEIRRSVKALKRNNEEHEGILDGPSMAPRFFSVQLDQHRP